MKTIIIKLIVYPRHLKKKKKSQAQQFSQNCFTERESILENLPNLMIKIYFSIYIYKIKRVKIYVEERLNQKSAIYSEKFLISPFPSMQLK